MANDERRKRLRERAYGRVPFLLFPSSPVPSPGSRSASRQYTGSGSISRKRKAGARGGRRNKRMGVERTDGARSAFSPTVGGGGARVPFRLRNKLRCGHKRGGFLVEGVHGGYRRESPLAAGRRAPEAFFPRVCNSTARKQRMPTDTPSPSRHSAPSAPRPHNLASPAPTPATAPLAAKSSLCLVAPTPATTWRTAPRRRRPPMRKPARRPPSRLTRPRYAWGPNSRHERVARLTQLHACLI